MEKKIIRLTESDLHRIVENSVKRVIKEMDYETYASAANKSFKLAKNSKTPEDVAFHTRRGENFAKHSENEFNKKFKVSDDDRVNKRLGRYDSVSDSALRGYKQLRDFNDGKRTYNKGAWRNKKE